MTVKNNIFSRLMGSFFGPYIALLLNLLIALGTYFVARVVYLLENYSYFSGHLSASYLWQIFAGGWMFDRSAIVYSNIPYIVMMLFPLWLKENNIYNKVCPSLKSRTYTLLLYPIHTRPCSSVLCAK